MISLLRIKVSVNLLNVSKVIIKIKFSIAPYGGYFLKKRKKKEVHIYLREIQTNH